VVSYVEVAVATVNDDFNSPGSNVPHVARLADVVLGQEGKAEDYAALLPHDEYDVFQNTETDALAGSFIVTRKVHEIAPGRARLIYAAPGRPDVMARYLACERVKIYDHEHTRPLVAAEVLFIAGHRDPRRRAELWPVWDANFRERVERAHDHKLLVIAGCDWNEHNPAVVRNSGLHWYSVGPREIDGFAASPGISFSQLHALPKQTSDHHPIFGVARIPAMARP
jgi:hypothetical protein